MWSVCLVVVGKVESFHGEFGAYPVWPVVGVEDAVACQDGLVFLWYAFLCELMGFYLD